jgi:putative DNA primase/helicase
MSILHPQAAQAINKLLQGLPSELVTLIPNGHGPIPEWQSCMVQQIAAAQDRLAAWLQITQSRDDRDSLTSEVFSADKPAKESDLHLSDTGNAEALVLLHGNTIRWDHRRGRWLIWSAHRWAPDTDGRIYRLMIETVRDRLTKAINLPDTSGKREDAIKWCLSSESRNKLESATQVAKALHPISDSGENWDKSPWLLGCGNGVLDLRTGDLRQGYPEDRITMATGITYDPRADCPRWMKFMDEVFNNNAETIAFIQRAVGYSLTGDTREQCLFLCWGGGANGKSTFLGTLRKALGDYAKNTPFSTFELNKQNLATNDLASLYGSRLVTASETSESSRLNEARVKALTGGDPITARFLFSEYYTYTPGYKVFLAMNHLPTIRGTDDGIWRRIRLIPFEVSCKGREDKTLEAQLENELPGILTWAMLGCLYWQQDGLGYPASVRMATENYRAVSDELAQFIEDETVRHPNAKCVAGALYQSYTEWAAKNNESPMTSTQFGRRMVEHGAKKEKLSGNIYYLGIGLTVKNGMFKDS